MGPAKFGPLETTNLREPLISLRAIIIRLDAWPSPRAGSRSRSRKQKAIVSQPEPAQPSSCPGNLLLQLITTCPGCSSENGANGLSAPVVVVAPARPSKSPSLSSSTASSSSRGQVSAVVHLRSRAPSPTHYYSCPSARVVPRVPRQLCIHLLSQPPHLDDRHPLVAV